MREQGIVTRIIPPDRIEVSLQASAACGHCGACRPDAEGRISIEALSRAGVNHGDQVEIEISTSGVATAGFMVYLLPIFFLIAGYLLGYGLAGFFPDLISGEGGGISGAIFLLVAGFWVVRRYDRHIRRQGKLMAKVIRILPGGESSANLDPGLLQ